MYMSMSADPSCLGLDGPHSGPLTMELTTGMLVYVDGPHSGPLTMELTIGMLVKKRWTPQWFSYNGTY